MNVSENGLNLIKEFEGCKLTAYKDSVGVWTIGWGTTNADTSITGITVKSGLTISQNTADECLKKSVENKYVPLVSKYKYNYNQNQFDALVSFCYNIGSIDQLTANGTRSLEEIASHITAYNKAGGKVLAGLTKRRQAELNLYNTPIENILYFDADLYVNKYADLKEAFGMNTEKLKQHYEQFGKKEGRIASYIFDPVYYLNKYADLKKAFKNDYAAAYNHFVTFGINEGRQASKEFNVAYYLNKYEDLKKAFGTDYVATIDHFVNFRN